MRSFSVGGYLLSDARLDVRLAYSGFLVLTTIGFGTLAALQVRHIGPWPADIAAYYLGGERGGTMSFAKTVRELVEVTHFHAFVMGIVYLILAHLMIATTAGPAVKRVTIVLGFVGLTGDLVGVWLIRYVSARFAFLQLAFWLAEWVSFAGFVYYPMREMWFRQENDDELPPD